MDLLKSDLERLYYYRGKRSGRVTFSDVLRNILSPRFAPVAIVRVAHALYRNGHPILARIASSLNFLLFGIEMAVRCEAGPGLCFPHTGGIVLGARAIGRNVTIYHGVTIGAKEMDVAYTPDKRPLVGDNVVIGAGAKILGGIRIGDNSVIGANAVVTRDIPPDSVAGGIPAKVIKKRDA